VLRKVCTGKRGKAIVAVITMLVVAGGALAYFTASGTGSGSASSGSTAQVELSASTPTTQLYPGGTSDVKLTVHNPNAFQVKIGRLSLNTAQGTSGFSVDAGHSGCDVSTLSFTAALGTQNNGGSGWDVPPSASAFPIDLVNAVTMGTSAANACQGASFTVYLQATPS
jgi:hypothetical protein